MQRNFGSSKNIRCCKLIQQKRFNFTSSTPLKDDIPINRFKNTSTDVEKNKNLSKIEKHLNGKPFDHLNRFSVTNYSTNDNSSLFLENVKLDNVPSPFVHFDETAALNILYHDVVYPKEFSKYEFFLRGKWDNLNNFDDKIDSILNWSKTNNIDYEKINNKIEKNILKFPIDIKTKMIDLLNDETNFDLKKTLDNLLILFPQYSFENLTILYINIIPDLTKEKKDFFISKTNDFFPQNILHFHDQTLETICDDLITFKQMKLVKTIIHCYDEFSNSESEFLTIVSKPFLQFYFEKLLEVNDIQMARNVLKIIMKSNYVPDIKLITNYFKIVSNVCLNADAPKDKREMLFNLFTKPLKNIIIKENMINNSIINSISKFIRLSILPNFISFLKLNPNYKHLTGLPDIIIERINESDVFKNLDDQHNSILFTSILDNLELNLNNLSDLTIKKIINIYAKIHSPLAVLKWSKLLKHPLDSNEKSEIFKLLNQGETNNISSKFDISDKL